MRRRRSLLVVVLLVMLALVVVLLARSGREQVTYDRAAAVRYADRWALRRNPSYWTSPTSDCANFVSQCVAAGGLRPFDGAGGGWRPAGTDFPAIAWVNCGRQKRLWARQGDGHSCYIVRSSTSLPPDWRPGDVVYLGTMKHGRPEWQHVIICVGREHGRWVYDSHTAPHLRAPMSTWYPAHFSLIRYCHLADTVTYD